MINVTKPFLPPIEEYQAYVDGVWKRNWLTNNGPLVNELELSLKRYLNLDHLLYLCNGTIALQIAIKALELKEEIITTPFSYVATSSSIVWEGCSPVFVDIDPTTFNIDPEKIESAITAKTSGILATHVFGNACNIDAINTIAKKHNLKVIYDAAHCFGSKYRGRSIYAYGDISTASFHATKLYHTTEGGAVVTNSPELTHKMAYLRNFGHNGTEAFYGIGINGKNSEFHAAMGLANLKYVESILKSRKQQSLYYDQLLSNLDVQKLKISSSGDFNYSYYPIVFKSEESLIKAQKLLESNWIYPRRYFYPCLSTLNYTKPQATPIADDISKKILCLPLFFDLTKEEQDLICRLLLRAQNYN